MTPHILVTQLVPQPAIDLLRQVGEVEINPDPDHILTKDELIAALKRNDYLYCLLTNRIDAQVLDANPGLKIVANMAVGYDNVDVPAATARGIPVTNTPGVLTETTADLAWALLMSLARRIVEADRFVRDGRFYDWGPMMMLGADVYGKTLGIIGLGRIGQAVARRARGFGMRVLYHNRRPADVELERQLGVTYAALDDLLQQSDVVSIHVPFTPQTHHMIGEHQLRLMKPTAFLINVARGPIVDETALVRALQEGYLAGAGLDVYEREPHVDPALLTLSNTVLLPHIGSATLETRTRMAVAAAENVVAVVEGKQPPNVVNPEIYERDE